MKKKGRVPGTALRKGKSSLPQAKMASFQESSGLANFTWCCIAATLATEVMEDRYFKTLSPTHSKPAMAGGCLNVSNTTPPCSPRNRMGENHGDRNRFPNQRSSGRLCLPTKVRRASTKHEAKPLTSLKKMIFYQKPHNESPLRRNHQQR